MNDDIRPRKTVPQRLFHLIGQPMRLTQRQRVFHLQMQLDETRRPRLPRAQDRARLSPRARETTSIIAAFVIRQRPIQQRLHRFVAHAQRAIQDVNADAQREQRVRPLKPYQLSPRAIRIAPFIMTSD